MAEENIGVRKKTQRKIKKWGDDGFRGHISFGCYTYEILFIHQDKIKNVVDLTGLGKVYGAISCDDQLIVIASNTTEQLKKLTVWHEIMHMIILNNNLNDGNKQTTFGDEGFTDVMASRIYELTTRNPELMRWLMK